jgi:hypothetical protein
LKRSSENRYSSLKASVSAFADRKKQFFNNLEEVKKVIHAEAVMEKSIAVEA